MSQLLGHPVNKFFQGLRPLTLSWALPLDHSLLVLTYGVIANISITGLFHLQTARKLYYNSHNCSWQLVDLYKQTCSTDLLDAGNLLCQCSLSDSHVPMVQFQKESISVFRSLGTSTCDLSPKRRKLPIICTVCLVGANQQSSEFHHHQKLTGIILLGLKFF